VHAENSSAQVRAAVGRSRRSTWCWPGSCAVAMGPARHPERGKADDIRSATVAGSRSGPHRRARGGTDWWGMWRSARTASMLWLMRA
jgi:hypothetical protein